MLNHHHPIFVVCCQQGMDVLKDFRDTDKGSERLSNLHVYRWAGCTALRQHLYCTSMISVEVGLCPESVHCNVLHWQCGRQGCTLGQAAAAFGCAHIDQRSCWSGCGRTNVRTASTLLGCFASGVAAMCLTVLNGAAGVLHSCRAAVRIGGDNPEGALVDSLDAIR